MIEMIQGGERHLHGGTLAAFYQLRARTLRSGARRKTKIKGKESIDCFDDCDPIYLISKDEHTGRIRGGLRLLPTTGPHVLRDVFSVLLPDGQVIESPLIWESSGFAIDLGLAPDGKCSLHAVAAELLCGVIEVGLLGGIDFVVSVCDLRIASLFAGADCPVDVIGVPTRIGGVMMNACLFEITDETRSRVARAGQITGSVFRADMDMRVVAA